MPCMLATSVIFSGKAEGGDNKEWQVLFPDPSAEFESLYLNISLDARMIP